MSEKTATRSKLRRTLKELIEDPQQNDESIMQQLQSFVNEPNVVPPQYTDSKDSTNLYSIGICYDNDRERWHCFTMQSEGGRVTDFRLYKPHSPSLRRLRALPQLTNTLAYKVFRR